MKDRGERRARTQTTVKRRVRKAADALIFGLGKQEKEQPHRVHKHKPKYTQDSGSLKFGKQTANRASRARARLAIRAGKENSVRWDYW
jgi:hypothetical protein